MRKVIIIIFMSLISSATFSEVTFIKSNRTIIYYDNGKEIAKETFDKNNISTIVGKIPDGITKEYYDKTVGVEGKDKEEAILQGWFYNGTEVSSETSFKDNKRNEISRFYKGEKLTSVSIFTGKKKVREINYSDLDSAEYSEEEKTENIVSRVYEGWSAVYTKGYYDDGKIKSEANYKDGKLDGLILEYNKNGNLKQEWSYKAGKLDGLSKWYYEDGKIWEEENYKDGKKNGMCKLYREDGEIVLIDTFKNNVKINSKKYNELGKEIMNQDYPYEAVFDDDNIKQGLADTLTTSFYKTKIFTVLERSKMNEIIKEQKFQLTGCTKTECAVEIGKILNVKYMVVGSIAKIGKEYTVNIRIVSVESSEVVIADMEKCSNETELIDTIKKVVENISGKKAFSADTKQNTIAILDLETKKD